MALVLQNIFVIKQIYKKNMYEDWKIIQFAILKYTYSESVFLLFIKKDWVGLDKVFF